MHNLIVIVLALLVSSCNETKDPIVGEIPGMRIDKGIQCFTEVENSTFKLSGLPNGIESEIAEYIDTSYGAPEYSDKIEIEDIKYVGEYDACNVTVKIWQYPCGETDKCHVGIQPWGDSYYTGEVNPQFDLPSI